jgi:hypothetical protein
MFTAAAAWCMRQAAGAAREKVQRDGQVAYLHYLDGRTSCGSSARTTSSAPAPKPRPKPDAADTNVRHAVYSALLDRLDLSAEDRDGLHRRGLDDAAIERFKYKSISPGKQSVRVACSLAREFGDAVVATIPGFVREERGECSGWTLATEFGRDDNGKQHRSILLVPVRDQDDRIVALMARLPNTTSGKYRYLSSSSRGGRTSGAPVHVTVGTKKPVDEIRLTEGPVKGDVSAHRTGIPSVCTPGANTCSGAAVDQLLALGARVVRVAFDADWRVNGHVADGVRRVIMALHAAGLRVLFETWHPSLGKGLDDVLAAGGTPEVLELKPGELPDDLRSAPSAARVDDDIPREEPPRNNTVTDVCEGMYTCRFDTNQHCQSKQPCHFKKRDNPNCNAVLNLNCNRWGCSACAERLKSRFAVRISRRFVVHRGDLYLWRGQRSQWNAKQCALSRKAAKYVAVRHGADLHRVTVVATAPAPGFRKVTTHRAYCYLIAALEKIRGYPAGKGRRLRPVSASRGWLPADKKESHEWVFVDRVEGEFVDIRARAEAASVLGQVRVFDRPPDKRKRYAERFDFATRGWDETEDAAITETILYGWSSLVPAGAGPPENEELV